MWNYTQSTLGTRHAFGLRPDCSWSKTKVLNFGFRPKFNLVLNWVLAVQIKLWP